MSRVIDLVPGCRVTVDQIKATATYIAQTRHPLWPHLQLVIWKLDDGTWSHDALSPMQDVGRIEPFTAEQLQRNLRAALLDAGQANRGRPRTRITWWTSS